MKPFPSFKCQLQAKTGSTVISHFSIHLALLRPKWRVKRVRWDKRISTLRA